METAEVERRSTAETELDLPTESLGKIIDIIQTIKHFQYIIEMDVLKSDENKTLDDEIDEMTPLKTELTDEGEEINLKTSK